MKAFTLMAVLFLPLFTLAQPHYPSSPAPLDGGILILLAAGAAYGGKKYWEKRKY